MFLIAFATLAFLTPAVAAEGPATPSLMDAAPQEELLLLPSIAATPANSVPPANSAPPGKPAIQTSANDNKTFLALRKLATSGDANGAKKLFARLSPNYLLIDDAEVYLFQARLASGEAFADSEITTFMLSRKGSYAAERLRQLWLTTLIKRRDYTTFNRFYSRFFDSKEPELQCYSLFKLHDSSSDSSPPHLTVLSSTEWSEGCTALLSALLNTGKLTPGQVWQVVHHFVDNRRREYAALVMQEVLGIASTQTNDLFRQPSRFARNLVNVRDDTATALGLLGLSLWARQDLGAASTWLLANASALAPAIEPLAFAQLALIVSLQDIDLALAYWLRTMPDTPLSNYAHEWRVRSALRVQAWPYLATWIGAMPEALQGDSTWQYWLAQSQMTHNPSQAQQRLSKLASQDTFYGDMARAQLQQPLDLRLFNKDPLPSTDRFNQALMRIKQWQNLGLYADMLKEWRWLTYGMNDDNLLALAEASCNLGLIDRCISAASGAGDKVDWQRRYPSYHLQVAATHAQKLNLDLALIYGVIRQESRFMVTARSPSGAMGLMQVMPETAKMLAREIGISFRANDYSPEKNILFGSHYLKRMLKRFDNAYPLTVAAYNAGPGRLSEWLNKVKNPLPAAVFIETIPFDETRGYVKNVLHNTLVYRSLLGLEPVTMTTLIGTTVNPPPR